MMSSPEVAGLLYKRRGGFGKMMPNAWQFRFFAITKDGVLLYFDTESFDADFDINKARGRLDLRATPYEYSTEPIEGAPTIYAIQIGSPNEEKWKMCAETKEDQTRWCKTLEKFLLEKSVRSKVLNNANTGDASAPPSSPSSSNTGRDIDLKPVLSAPASPVITESKSFRDTASPSSPSRETTTIPTPTLPATSKEAAPSKSVQQPPKVTATAPAAPAVNTGKSSRQKKGGLKLASKKSFIDQESIEWYLVIVIINISFIGVWRSKSFLLTVLYILISNVVVGYTLKLRYERVQKAQKLATASSQEKVGATSGSEKVSDQATKDTTVVASVKSANTEAEEETEVVPASVKTGASGKPLPGTAISFILLICESSPPFFSFDRIDISPIIFGAKACTST